MARTGRPAQGNNSLKTQTIRTFSKGQDGRTLAPKRDLKTPQPRVSRNR